MNKKITLIASLVLLAVIFIMTNTSSDSKPNKDTLSKYDTSKPTGSKNSQIETIATKWQWQDEFPYPEKAQVNDPVQDLPFTAKSVHDSLQAVKVDADGNIILDHDALLSLDEALERSHNLLDNESLVILQDLIIQALPGKVGEQTAQLVADYYDFLKAQQEFSRIDKLTRDNSVGESVEAIESDQALYAELQSLREVYLGHDATNSLFRISDANAKFMFESMKLERDTSLTPQQKQMRRQDIQDEFTEYSVNVVNWPSRYRAFISAKQSIIATSMSDEDKRQQVTELLNQSFSDEELAKIKYLGLEQI